MTISATGRRYTYTGNGVTVNFSFPRPFNLDADLKVYLVTTATGIAVLQTIATHYTLTGAGNPAGGTVTFLTAPPTGQTVVIFADTDATQNLDLDAVTSWPMTSIEYAFDRLTVMVQEIWDRLLRVPYAPREYINTFDYKLPQPVASKILGVKSDGSGFEYVVNVAGAVPLTTEEVQDIVGAMVVAGTNVTVNYNDAAGTITISSTGGGGGASVTTSDTAPVTPADGDLWWNSSDGNLYVFYDDGTSSQWVDAMTAGTLSAAEVLALLLTVDGAGSGIDADLLDGISSSGFALASHTHAWADITGEPTTIGGYGITDFNSLGDARWSLLAHTHTFASLTSKPTTLSGYGITDAQPLDADLTALAAITGVQGDIIYRNATAWVKLAAGTSGWFLKTQGAAADPIWANIPGGGDALVANPLSQFAATTSLQLKGVLSDETGSGALVFATSPTLVDPVVGTQAPGNNTTLGASTAFVKAAIDVVLGGVAAAFDTLAEIAAELALKASIASLDNTKIATITFIIDGGGAAITTGLKGYLEIPFACTIIGHTTLLDQSGSIVIDIWKDTYANFPPLVADTITGSDKPTVSAAVKAQDLAPTGWTTAIAAGDILAFNVDSITTATRCTISLKVVKT